MSLVLGRKTTYTNEKFDIENIYIDYAKNRCVFCVSPNNEDLAYFQKLIAMNLRTMDAVSHTIKDINLPLNEPEFYDLNPLVSTFYPVEERMKDFGYDSILENEKESYIKQFEENCVHYRAEELDMLWDRFLNRKNTLEILRQVENVREYEIQRLMDYFGELEEYENDEVKKKCMEILFDMGLEQLKEDDSNVWEFMNNDLSFLGDILEERLKIDLQRYYRYKFLKKCPSYKIFEPCVVFLTGIENIERLPNWFSEYLSNGTDYNILTFIFSTTAVRFEIREASNYVFVSGDNVRIFEDYYGKKPPKGGSGIKFFGTVKNTNKRFAFKKYRCKLNEPTTKAIDFDSLLGNLY